MFPDIVGKGGGFITVSNRSRLVIMKQNQVFIISMYGQFFVSIFSYVVRTRCLWNQYRYVGLFTYHSNVSS